MGVSTHCKDFRVVMKEEYCSSGNPVASKGLCWKWLRSGWCSFFVFKILIFPNARWNIVRSSVFLSQPTNKLMGQFDVVCNVHHIAMRRWPTRCTVLINNIYSTIFSCTTCFERITLSSSGALPNILYHALWYNLYNRAEECTRLHDCTDCTV